MYNPLQTVCDKESTWESRIIVIAESYTLIKYLVPKSIVEDRSENNNIVPLVLKLSV